MRRMLSWRSGGKAIDPIAVRALVRQSARNQPVEDTIQRNAIERRNAQRRLDFVVRQSGWRSAQQLQYANAGRCRALAGATNLLGDRFSAWGKGMAHGVQPGRVLSSDLTIGFSYLQRSCR